MNLLNLNFQAGPAVMTKVTTFFILQIYHKNFTLTQTMFFYDFILSLLFHFHVLTNSSHLQPSHSHST